MIKYLFEGGKLSNKVMTTSSFLIGTFKQASWSANALTLLMGSNKSSPCSILHVKNSRQNEDNVRQISHLVDVAMGLHASTSPLQLIICNNWLPAKLSIMMDIVFLTCLRYYFLTLGSTLEGATTSDTSIMLQRSAESNPISNLNFPNIAIILIEIVNDSSTLTLKWCHVTLKD